MIGALQALVLWAALGSATLSCLLPRLGRWGWWLAELLLLAWLALAGHPVLALALAAGAAVAQVIDSSGTVSGPGFTGLLRSMAAVVLAYAGAGLVLVSLLHAEVALALKAFPALATALLAVAVLVLAEADREQLRVSRLLVVLAAVAWIIAGGPEHGAAAYIAAVWLPLLAGAGRLRFSPGV